MSANLSFKDLWLRFAAIKQLHRKECTSKHNSIFETTLHPNKISYEHIYSPFAIKI